MTLLARLPLFAVALLAVATASASTIKSERERDELKGPVKSVAVRWEANHKDEAGGIEQRDLGITTYDTAGNVIDEKDFTADFIRDRKPERIDANTVIFRSVMGDEVLHYDFDAQGNVVELQKWYGAKAEGPADLMERTKYDAAGLAIESSSFETEGKLFDTTIFTRDAAGNVVVEEIRTAGSAPPFPRMHYTYTFDARGNWTARLVKRENVPEDSYDYRYYGNLYRTIEYY